MAGKPTHSSMHCCGGKTHYQLLKNNIHNGMQFSNNDYSSPSSVNHCSNFVHISLGDSRSQLDPNSTVSILNSVDDNSFVVTAVSGPSARAFACARIDRTPLRVMYRPDLSIYLGNALLWEHQLRKFPFYRT